MQQGRWNECYDHLSNVNRIHPKDINGQPVSSTSHSRWEWPSIFLTDRKVV